MENWGEATRVANSLMPPYPGQRVADLTPVQQEIIKRPHGNIDSTSGAFTQAGQATSGLMGFNPSMITPQTLAGTNLKPYMDPYIQSVIDPSMALLEQQRMRGVNQ